VEVAGEALTPAGIRTTARSMDKAHDNLLMLQVKAGDLDKLGVLFERYKLPLYRYFYLRTGDGVASEDLVQNVFLRIINHRERYRPVGEFKSWIFSIAHNLGVDHLRTRGRYSSFEETVEIGADRSDTAEEDLLRDERISLLEKAMQGLRDDYREALILSRYEGLRYHEIGEILGCSEGAVKTRVHRAMEELRKRYHELE
jgi:RNA polymerase sigma factor (sigma-70 family)